jgi:methyl-accepting chemotaxis protein PixJ
MTNSAHHNYLELSPEQVFQRDYSPSPSWWQRQSIRFKTTVLAIAIGTIPTITISSIAYYFANQSIVREIVSAKQETATEVANKVAYFMRERYGDIQIMSSLSILTDSTLRSQTTNQAKQAALNQFIQAYTIYDSIAAFDLNGNVLAQSSGEPLSNHKDRSYFQAALKTNGAVLSQPLNSKSSGIIAVYLAAPIKDANTGTTIGILRARMPIKYLRDVILSGGTENNYLLDDQGNIFAAADQKEQDAILNLEAQTQPASDRFDIYPALQQTNQKTTKITEDLLVSYVPFSNFTDEFRAQLPNLGWSTITTQDKQLVFAPQRQLSQVFILGTGIVALGVGAIAYTLANRLLQPILQAADAVQEIGAGDFTTRLNLKGTDEIAQLGKNVNQMAVRLASLVQGQTLIVQQSQSLRNIALQLVNVVNKSEIPQIAIQASYQALNADRIAYYQLTDVLRFQVTAEYRDGSNQAAILHQDLPLALVTEYAQQPTLTVEIINNVALANISVAKKQYLTSLAAESCLIAPVVVEDKLDGLLMIYQSITPLPWLDEEIEFVTQVAAQIAFATIRLGLLEQQKLAEVREKSAKEAIQRRALSLLQEVYDVSGGDLTIRARVTDDEIGTIADSYNSTIESLQKLVNQTKAAVIEVKTNTSSNNEAVQSLAAETVAQAEAITRMLEQVKGMDESISLVSTQARQAEDFVQQAALTLDRSDQAMNRTVAEINAVQNTVIQTASKAEKLGESSQEISQAVNLISRFAAQTHLLALKASIEAARAGEQGKGFAVIADEVRSLATQSAEATSEIETLVSKIQLETGEVVMAMNQGAEQIASGNKLVQQTRQSLTQVTQASHEISKLVGSITQSAADQSATTAEVNQTIARVAAIAQSNSQFATKVSASIRQLSEIAAKLQSNVDQFKT